MTRLPFPADRQPDIQTPGTSPGVVAQEPAVSGRGTGPFPDAPQIHRLLEAYGSPLFLLSETALRKNARHFRKAFSRKGIELRFAYSYKTNYLPALCRILHEEGAWAEVVSGLEGRLARKLGVPGNQIIFGGPCKTPEELETAVGEEILIIIDGFDELAAVSAIARKLGKKARTGLRLRLDDGQGDSQGAQSPWARFGFAVDNGEAGEALAHMAADGGLDLRMLHAHAGTFCLDPQVYGKRAQGLARLAAAARQLGLSPTMVNLGGGFPANTDLTPYGEAIMESLNEAPGAFGEVPTLVLEPGRALVDSAMELVARVVAVKSTAAGGPLVFLDAGVHLLPRACRPYPRPILALEKGGEPLMPTAVYGPLCMPEDLLDGEAPLPALSPGDPVVIQEAGAYTVSQSMPFIRSRPAVVLIGAQGPELIRRREEDEDFFALDVPAP